MTDISASVTINARPQIVFDTLCDVERWPEWSDAITNARRLEAGALAVRSRVRILQPKLLPAIWQVIELNALNFTWVNRRPGIQATAGHLVEARRDGCQVTLTLRFSGLLAPLVARVYGERCQRYLSLEAEGLRKRCEHER
jgi:hypothetical protein